MLSERSAFRPPFRRGIGTRDISNPTTGGGGVLPFRQFGNHLALPVTKDTSKTWSRGGRVFRAPSDYAGELEFSFPAWCASSSANGSTAGPNGGATEVGSAGQSATFEVNYIDKDTGLPVSKALADINGDVANLSAAAGSDFKLYAAVNVAAGSKVEARHRINWPGGILYTLFVGDTANGDWLEFGTSAPASVSAAPVDTFPGTVYGPYMIRARHSGLVVAILDDSTGVGVKDCPNTAKGDSGGFARLFGEAGISYVNLSSPGEKAQEFATGANSVRRRAAVVASGADFVAVGFGKNDFIAGRSAANILADNKSIIAGLALAKPAILKTVSPYTIAGNYTTPAGTDSLRTGYNDLVRAEPVFWDAAKVLEDASISGAWGSYYAAGIDEGQTQAALHESNLGNKWAAEQGQLFGVTMANHGLTARAMGSRMSMPSNPVQANYITQQDVSNAYWDKGSPARITATAATIRDLCKLRETTQNGQHSFFNASAITRASAAKTFIAFIDAEPVAGADFMRLTLFDGAFSATADCYFDMTAKTVSFATQDGTKFTGTIGRVTALPGTSMYRYEIEFGAAAGNTNFYFVGYMQPDLATNSYVGSPSNGWNIGKMWIYNKNASAGGS